MRLRQLRDFVAVVETGSVRAGARQLGVSQPALTKSIRSLEAELQAQLLQRSPQGVVPTRSGRAFFTRAKAAQIELRKAQEELAQIGGRDAGSVAFGAGALVTSLIVPEAVASFRAKHARSPVHIIEGFPQALLPMVRDETLDFAIGPRFDAKLDGAFSFRPLFRNGFALVVRKGHPLRSAQSLSALAQAEWLSVFPAGAQSPLAKVFSAQGLATPEPLIRCESFNVALSLVLKTDAVGIISRLTLQKVLPRDYLHHIKVKEPLPEFTVGLYTRSDSPLSRAASAMANEIADAARSLASFR